MGIKTLLRKDISQQDLLNYFNASIIYENLPSEINGCVFNYDDINFILINQNLSNYKKKKTILHELAHIELNQLCQTTKDLFELNIEKYEDEADKYIKKILNDLS